MTKSINGPSVQIATTDAELVEIERFRYSIYIDEMHKPLPWANHVERRLPDADDHDALHTYIREDADVVACARLPGRRYFRPACGSSKPMRFVEAMRLSSTDR